MTGITWFMRDWRSGRGAGSGVRFWGGEGGGVFRLQRNLACLFVGWLPFFKPQAFSVFRGVEYVPKRFSRLLRNLPFYSIRCKDYYTNTFAIITHRCV